MTGYLVTMEVRALVSRYTASSGTKDDAVSATMITLADQIRHTFGGEAVKVTLVDVRDRASE